MADAAELQARIAAIAGKINQHKQHQSQPIEQGQQPHSPQNVSSYHRGRGRWTPYGRGGRASYQTQPYRNRSLVLNGTGTPPASPFESTPIRPLVSTRGTHNQLMTKDTYEREQNHKEQMRAAKRHKRNIEEQHRVLRQFDTLPGDARHIIVLNDVPFRLTDDGSKLVREFGEHEETTRTSRSVSKLSMSDPASSAVDTPKKVEIAGVAFSRTKHGNLVRRSALTVAARQAQTKQAPQCEHFTKQGVCPFGPVCRFAHDPDKVAICKDFLRAGTCPSGDSCDLSHDMTYHRVSACNFFLRGNCTNDACRYPHVRVSPTALVCRPFATLGYCAKGAACDKRHVHECPDYANRGFCANYEARHCQLPHPDRANVLRKAAERKAKMAAGEESDLSSDDEEASGSEDVDSDVEDIIMTGIDKDSHELTQQQDFVAFS